jgi:hypothetical protein
LIGERLGWNVRHHGAVILHPHPPIGGHFTDVNRVEIPLVEDALDFALAAALDDEQHALLRFGQHDLVRRHTGLTLRHHCDIDFDPGTPA